MTPKWHTDGDSRRGLGLGCPAAIAGGVALVWFVAGTSTRSSRNERAATPASVPLTSYSGDEDVPTFSPDGNQVAFMWNGPNKDNWDIYVKLVGENEPLRLTKDPSPDYSPAWSPDGLLDCVPALSRADSGARTEKQSVCDSGHRRSGAQDRRGLVAARGIPAEDSLAPQR